MIPLAQITNWRARAPWASDDDVEQDLLISRAIVDVFNAPFLRDRLAFRGGTALHKLILAPATRYSEDIDFVLLQREAIGPVFDAFREVLAWINPKANTDIGMFAAMYFRFQTNAGNARRLKAEIATRESFSAPRVIETAYAVDSPFFKGSTSVRTYTLEELLATKFRALYQRKKGRDLYDLWWAAQKKPVDFNRVYTLFLEYWKNDGRQPLMRRDVAANMKEKRQEGVFADVAPLLTPNAMYDDAAAYAWFEREILPLFPI